ncbi:MAG: DUF2911 domain-containing protein [Leptolyngbya sp.]|nr:DUF2911 domain-containing protein [Candidatus Melainabacteria bacterium]
MMNLKPLSLLLSIGGGLMIASGALAETVKLEFPAASPACTLKQRVGLTDVEINYSRPGVRGREIFGKQLPYGQVWRTGANGATKVVFSTDVKLNGNTIPAGTYALMTIPGKDEWTVIINKGAEQWGSYKYDEKADVVRFKVKPLTCDKSLDAFTIEFNDLRDSSSTLNLAWDKTVIPIKLEVDYIDKLTADIDKAMSSDEAKKPYFQAAKFYLDNGKDLAKASKWIDAAIAEREAFYIVHVKAQILAKQGEKAAALTAAKRSKELAEKSNDGAYVLLNNELIQKLQ